MSLFIQLEPRAPLGGAEEKNRQEGKTGKPTATATNLTFFDFSYLTLLRKRASIATMSNFSNLNKV